jgi:hypothetical protein
LSLLLVVVLAMLVDAKSPVTRTVSITFCDLQGSMLLEAAFAHIYV